MKLKDFLAKFKQKEKLISTQQSIPQQKPVSKEKKINIEISQCNNFLKLIVADYYEIYDYVNKIKEIDDLGIEKLLNNSVVWDSRRQRVNKGSYYVFRHNDNLYNILINDEKIRIDERIPVGEETVNKVFTFFVHDTGYRYFRCIHDKNGSSYDVWYYSPASVPMLEMSRADFLSDFNRTMQSLSSFEGIENIVDLHKMKYLVSQPTWEETLSK